MKNSKTSQTPANLKHYIHILEGLDEKIGILSKQKETIQQMYILHLKERGSRTEQKMVILRAIQKVLWCKDLLGQKDINTISAILCRVIGDN